MVDCSMSSGDLEVDDNDLNQSIYVLTFDSERSKTEVDRSKTQKAGASKYSLCPSEFGSGAMEPRRDCDLRTCVFSKILNARLSDLKAMLNMFRSYEDRGAEVADFQVFVIL